MKEQLVEERKNQMMVIEEYSFDHFLTTILKDYYGIQNEIEITQIIECVCNEIGWNQFNNKYCNDTCPCLSYILLLHEYIDIDKFIEDWSIDTELFEMEFLIPIRREIIIDEIVD
jgi:hypothetical protein